MAATVLEPKNDDDEKKTQKPAFDAIAAIRAAYATPEVGKVWDIKPVGSDTYRLNLRKAHPTDFGGLVMQPIVMSKFIQCVVGDDGKVTIHVRERQ